MRAWSELVAQTVIAPECYCSAHIIITITSTASLDGLVTRAPKIKNELVQKLMSCEDALGKLCSFTVCADSPHPSSPYPLFLV